MNKRLEYWKMLITDVAKATEAVENCHIRKLVSKKEKPISRFGKSLDGWLILTDQ
jgi:hypothetical protein